MNQESQELESTLQKPDVHNSWENAYRTPENAQFYDLAIEYIAGQIASEKTLTLLDAGCGICDYSLRLARHNFDITAVDFSESVLKTAEANVRSHGFHGRIHLQPENLLSLSFPDESFDRVLCWGVLMHIPDVGRAMAELGRVLKKGGILVISEGNRDSLESRLLSGIKGLLGRNREEVVETRSGREYWADGPAGRLLTRQMDIDWLLKRFAAQGLTVQHHVAGQFTELYCRTSSRLLQRLFHAVNRFWFSYVKSPTLAYGNIIFFRKETGANPAPIDR